LLNRYKRNGKWVKLNRKKHTRIQSRHAYGLGLMSDSNGLYTYEEDTVTPIKISERVRRYLNKRNLGKKLNNIYQNN